MRFLSVCSGIEAASVAWEPLGWKAVAFSEIEPFPCAVLAHHYPDTPNWGDMTKYKDWPNVSIDLLCGGTPCQSFSVAGLRKGLDDPRGNLMLTFGAIAAKYRPKWLVWENVPGVLSSNGGADFGAFLGMLGQLGYGFAYRICDAQYHGVAQRRRRVFVVGCLGDWHSAAAVLFERHSLQGHPAPSREAGQSAARGIEIGPAGGRFTDLNPTLDTSAKDGPVRNQLAGTVMQPTVSVCPTLRAGGNKTGGDRPPGTDVDTADSLIPVSFHENQRGEISLNVTVGALNKGGGKPGQGYPAIAFPANLSGTQCAATEDLAPSMGASNPTAVAYLGGIDNENNGFEMSRPCGPLMKDSPSGGGRPLPAVAYTTKLHNTQSNQAGKVYEEYTVGLDRNSPPPALLTAMQVRRLTPGECESLQGFPQGYTNVPHRNKPAADGPRYKALGNSWAVPNVRWIGQRIDAVALVNTAQPAIKPVAEREAA